jgi:hypothetical protein
MRRRYKARRSQCFGKSSTVINSRGEIAYLFGCLLLQPSTGLLNKGLIVSAVCTIADDRYNAALEIFFGCRRILVVGATNARRVNVGCSRGDIDVKTPHCARVKITTAQGAG